MKDEYGWNEVMKKTYAPTELSPDLRQRLLDNPHFVLGVQQLIDEAEARGYKRGKREAQEKPKD